MALQKSSFVAYSKGKSHLHFEGKICQVDHWLEYDGN